MGLLAQSICSCGPRNTYEIEAVTEGGIASLDWALAETLLVLGVVPSAVVGASDWERFVVEPLLPNSVADLGLQQELNFERLAALRPRLILTSPFLAHLEPQLHDLAETANLSVFDGGGAPLSQRIAVTYKIGDLSNTPDAAHTYVGEVESTLNEAARRLTSLTKRPLVLATFVDERHVRVYGGTSLYAEVLGRLGLKNGWAAPTGFFGFSTVGIERLAELGNVEFISFDPVLPGIGASLRRSPLWQQLPFVRAGHAGSMPPVLMFGGLPSARRFTELLVPYLESRWA